MVATGLCPSGLTMDPFVGAIATGIALGEPPGIDLPLNSLRPAPDPIDSATPDAGDTPTSG